MPNYDYRCERCHHAWVGQLLIARRDVPVDLPCPICKSEHTIERLPAAPGFSHLMAGPKVPEGFKDVLRRIKKNNAGSLIDNI